MNNGDEAMDTPEGGNVAALPVPAGQLIELAAPIEALVANFNQYQVAYDRLLISTGPPAQQDFQYLNGKKFPTKSAFRKLATAMAVTTKLVQTDKDWETPEGGGRRYLRLATVKAQAIAPNGRVAEAEGACDVFEKCCPKAEGRECKANHKHCINGCPGTVHFSHPSHDMIGTAGTRAVNRACSDLFGMGQVSAEEVTGGNGQGQGPEATPPAGWNDWGECNGTHEAIAARVNEEVPAGVARAPFKEHMAKYGWPMAKGALDALITMLDERKLPQEGEPPKGPIAQEPEKRQATMEAIEAQAVAGLHSRVDAEMEELGLHGLKAGQFLTYVFGGPRAVDEMDAGNLQDLLDTMQLIRDGSLTWHETEDGGEWHEEQDA